jgi:hypothetical protein
MEAYRGNGDTVPHILDLSLCDQLHASAVLLSQKEILVAVQAFSFQASNDFVIMYLMEIIWVCSL